MADIDRIEEEITTRQQNVNNSELVFLSKASAGSNPVELARIVTAFDFVIGLLGWEKKPLANLSKFLLGYQASIDAKYHNDFKDVLVAEEVERKSANRKGVSIFGG